ncbi:transposase [Streptomyces sp. NPDC007205]|uniref:transposase n=1 Tax=Streptomyces sp. NPDC007205 TaxID=3154316 RepID=UPI0033C73C63
MSYRSTPADRGMRPPVVVAGAAYGTNAHLRSALSDRKIGYVLAVRAKVTARPLQKQPVAPPCNGPIGCRPQPRYHVCRTARHRRGNRPVRACSRRVSPQVSGLRPGWCPRQGRCRIPRQPAGRRRSAPR